MFVPLNLHVKQLLYSFCFLFACFCFCYFLIGDFVVFLLSQILSLQDKSIGRRSAITTIKTQGKIYHLKLLRFWKTSPWVPILTIADTSQQPTFVFSCVRKLSPIIVEILAASTIPDDRGYLRFLVVISRWHLEQSGNREIPDRLGFLRHMKTKLNLASKPNNEDFWNLYLIVIHD